MFYSQEQIDRANQVNLEDFLRTQGETLTRSGKEYRWKCHDSLTVRGNKWFRHSQSKGGYPVDFVMEFYGKSFPEAVRMLISEEGTGVQEARPAPPPDFRLPLPLASQPPAPARPPAGSDHPGHQTPPAVLPPAFRFRCGTRR